MAAIGTVSICWILRFACAGLPTRAVGALALCAGHTALCVGLPTPHTRLTEGLQMFNRSMKLPWRPAVGEGRETCAQRDMEIH